jgi:hypothetical protein
MPSAAALKKADRYGVEKLSGSRRSLSFIRRTPSARLRRQPPPRRQRLPPTCLLPLPARHLLRRLDLQPPYASGISGHDCCPLSENVCRSARRRFFLCGDELSQGRTAIQCVQVGPVILAELHFEELDGSHVARYVSTKPSWVLLLRPCDYG